MGAGRDIAVITGGSSGIGKECARLLAAQGAKVYLVGRSQERLDKALDELRSHGADCEGIACDVSDEAHLERAVERVTQAEGKVDHLILSHGVMHLRPVEELALADFEQMMRINYLGTVASIKAFLPAIRAGRRKRIAILSSLAAKVAPPYFSAYSASKSAVSGFAHALRQELATEGIKVTLVLPGPVETPLIDGYIHGRYYTLPPGVPIVSAAHVARRIVKSLGRAPRELLVPGRFLPVSWLAALWPASVDVTYRWVSKRSRGREE